MGRHNLFGHPAASTLVTLRDAGTTIYRTDRCGAVTVSAGAAVTVTSQLDCHEEGAGPARRHGAVSARRNGAVSAGVESAGVIIHVVDGTYELFRHYYALAPARDADGREIAAVRGVLASIRMLLKDGATHIGVATDHVIESFRNGLWAGYKNGDGIEPELLAQFPLLEEALVAAGITVWPMVEFEADDALASAAAAASAEPQVERVVICTPDKDLAQCVRGTRVVQLNRRTRTFFDEAGVVAKFGVPPVSIPDYLALVGDAADGFPGLPGWGAKSAAAVLAKYGRLEDIPADPRAWSVNVASPAKLAQTLERDRDRALLFRQLATLRTDLQLFDHVDELRWNGTLDTLPVFARDGNDDGQQSGAAP